MIWQFTLVDSSNAEFAIQEPIGWDEITWTAKRNLMHHGIFFNINTGNLKYIELGFDMLLAEYELNGADGTMQLKIEYQCTPQETFEQFFFGKFDFNTFKRTCSKECFIECQVIATDCTDKFMSAIDTDISLDTTKDLEGNTISHILEQTMLLQGQDIILNNKANIPAGGGICDNTICFNTTLTGYKDFFIPVYFPNTAINDFGEFNSNNANCNVIRKDDGATNILFPMSQADFDNYYNFMWLYKPEFIEGLNCIGNTELNIKIKGSFTVHPETKITCSTYLRIAIVNPLTSTPTYLHDVSFGTEDRVIDGGDYNIVDFDFAWTDTIGQLGDGQYLHAYFQVQTQNIGGADPCKDLQLGLVMNEESYFTMANFSECPSSFNKSYNVNDVFEFIPNVISNGCFTVNANNSCLDYYSICNGLQIRNVVSPRPQVFLNFSDYFKNITKIFNLGWGFTNNETELLIDDVRNFYADSIITDVGSVNQIEFQNAQELNYSLINFGYSTWEAEEYSGLDEMNTARQYRRNVTGFNKPIDLVSNFIAAGYTIEITRRKGLDRTSNSDWRYDDSIFVINNSNTGSNVTAFRGIEADPENVFSPGTRMNYIITPVRNLMRWFKSLAMSPDYTNEILTFNSSNGNYIAGGQMTSYCPIEAGQIFENETITSADFLSQDDAKPIWKPMYMTFECPLTMAQKILIQANPYSMIKANCNGIDYYGSIISCDYSPNQGTAKFKLLEKIIYG